MPKSSVSNSVCVWDRAEHTTEECSASVADYCDSAGGAGGDCCSGYNNPAQEEACAGQRGE